LGDREEEAHRKNELSEVWSARGEWWWGGGRPAVVVSSLRCGEVILSGAVLGVWSNRTKRGWSGLYTVAQRR
jgi:hypothetical protein